MSEVKCTECESTFSSSLRKHLINSHGKGSDRINCETVIVKSWCDRTITLTIFKAMVSNPTIVFILIALDCFQVSLL